MKHQFNHSSERFFFSFVFDHNKFFVVRFVRSIAADSISSIQRWGTVWLWGFPLSVGAGVSLVCDGWRGVPSSATVWARGISRFCGWRGCVPSSIAVWGSLPLGVLCSLFPLRRVDLNSGFTHCCLRARMNRPLG